MGRRTWIKVYCDKWLQGSLREETAELRGIWTDVLTLAGGGHYSDIGTIQLAERVGYTDQQLAAIFNVPEAVWLEAKDRLLVTDRINLNGGNVIGIVNWKTYQSEYQRQKPYRIEEDTEKDKEDIDIDNRMQNYNFRMLYEGVTESDMRKLQQQYPNLNITNEFDHCCDHWSESTKKLKRPKSAFRNWLNKALEIQREHPDNTGSPDRDKYQSGRFGHIPRSQ